MFQHVVFQSQRHASATGAGVTVKLSCSHPCVGEQSPQLGASATPPDGRLLPAGHPLPPPPGLLSGRHPRDSEGGTAGHFRWRPGGPALCTEHTGRDERGSTSCAGHRDGQIQEETDRSGEGRVLPFPRRGSPFLTAMRLGRACVAYNQKSRGRTSCQSAATTAQEASAPRAARAEGTRGPARALATPCSRPQPAT